MNLEIPHYSYNLPTGQTGPGHSVSQYKEEFKRLQQTHRTSHTHTHTQAYYYFIHENIVRLLSTSM